MFGHGSNLGGGNFAVYDGPENDIVVTGLTQGVNYYFKVFEYNGYGNAANYFTSGGAEINGISGSVSVVINATSTELCTGDSVLLIAQGASTYSWTPSSSLSSAGGSSVYAFPVVGTNYIVTGTDANGCQSHSSVSITVHALPTVTLAAPLPICANANPITLTGGLPAGGHYNGIGISGNYFDPNQTGAGVFDIEYTYTNSDGCSNSAQSTITVNSLPVISFSSIPALCQNASAIALNYASPVGGNYSGTGVVGSAFDPAVSGSGTFSIVYNYIDTNGCSNSLSSAITVNPLPVISVSGSLTICENAPPLVLNNCNPASGLYSGVGISNGIFTPSAGSGSYTVNYAYTDSNSCTVGFDYSLEVKALPLVDLGTDTIVCADNSIVLDAGNGFTTYLWSNGFASSSIVVDSAGIGLNTGVFYVIVTDSFGCSNADSVNVTFDLCAGIEFAGADLNEVSIFPNPFSDNFILSSQSRISYFIFDATGRLIDFKKDFSGLISVGDTYSPGVYFVKMQVSQQRKIVRVVKGDF
ncbi:MAG: T9SS type A sorting domain-containing protein [Bacteroidetes bacterium]|nr:T9SS type A sorting domain-containing protein [Bacteroidota bacterium]